MTSHSKRCEALRRTRVKFATAQTETPHMIQTLDHIRWYAKHYNNAQGQDLLA